MLDDEVFDLGAVMAREPYKLEPQHLGVASIELAADLVSFPLLVRALRQS